MGNSEPHSPNDKANTEAKNAPVDADSTAEIPQEGTSKATSAVATTATIEAEARTETTIPKGKGNGNGKATNTSTSASTSTSTSTKVSTAPQPILRHNGRPQHPLLTQAQSRTSGTIQSNDATFNTQDNHLKQVELKASEEPKPMSQLLTQLQARLQAEIQARIHLQSCGSSGDLAGSHKGSKGRTAVTSERRGLDGCNVGVGPSDGPVCRASLPRGADGDDSNTRQRTTAVMAMMTTGGKQKEDGNDARGMVGYEDRSCKRQKAISDDPATWDRETLLAWCLNSQRVLSKPEASLVYQRTLQEATGRRILPSGNDDDDDGDGDDDGDDDDPFVVHNGHVDGDEKFVGKENPVYPNRAASHMMNPVLAGCSMGHVEKRVPEGKTHTRMDLNGAVGNRCDDDVTLEGRDMSRDSNHTPQPNSRALLRMLQEASSIAKHPMYNRPVTQFSNQSKVADQIARPTLSSAKDLTDGQSNLDQLSTLAHDLSQKRTLKSNDQQPRSQVWPATIASNHSENEIKNQMDGASCKTTSQMPDGLPRLRDAYSIEETTNHGYPPATHIRSHMTKEPTGIKLSTHSVPAKNGNGPTVSHSQNQSTILIQTRDQNEGGTDSTPEETALDHSFNVQKEYSQVTHSPEMQVQGEPKDRKCDDGMPKLCSGCSLEKKRVYRYLGARVPVCNACNQHWRRHAHDCSLCKKLFRLGANIYLRGIDIPAYRARQEVIYTGYGNTMGYSVRPQITMRELHHPYARAPPSFVPSRDQTSYYPQHGDSSFYEANTPYLLPPGKQTQYSGLPSQSGGLYRL